jgi:hypothetical protein
MAGVLGRGMAALALAPGGRPSGRATKRGALDQPGSRHGTGRRGCGGCRVRSRTGVRCRVRAAGPRRRRATPRSGVAGVAGGHGRSVRNVGRPCSALQTVTPFSGDWLRKMVARSCRRKQAQSRQRRANPTNTEALGSSATAIPEKGWKHKNRLALAGYEKGSDTAGIKTTRNQRKNCNTAHESVMEFGSAEIGVQQSGKGPGQVLESVVGCGSDPPGAGRDPVGR